MNVNFELVARHISDKQLLDATETIVRALDTTVKSYFVIGSTLAKINEEKLYKSAFGTFDDYTNNVFGISKSTAYRMINVTRKFLQPELALPDKDKIFSSFEDTALAALNPIGDYNSTVDFINENGITPQTPVSEIRKAVKRFQDEEKEITEVDADCEETEETAETEENSNDNTAEKITEDLEKTLNEFVTNVNAFIDDFAKSPSKRRKTPVKKMRECINHFTNILDNYGGDIK